MIDEPGTAAARLAASAASEAASAADTPAAAAAAAAASAAERAVEPTASDAAAGGKPSEMMPTVKMISHEYDAWDVDDVPVGLPDVFGDAAEEGEEEIPVAADEIMLVEDSQAPNVD